jgi:glucosamine--fructose-6-phosphate aminotransferase (isomerizing)
LTIMLREIGEQPAALERTLRRESEHMARVAGYLKKKRPPVIVLVARGTSDNAALFGRYLLELTTGIPVSLCAPSIHTLYRRRLVLKDALVVGISQSGEGEDINGVLESCKRSGAFTVAITNNRRSRTAGIAHEVFLTRAGVERSIAATKTYTCQLMLLYMLASAMAEGRYGEIERIPEYAEAALHLAPEVEALIGRYRFANHCAVVGRGLNYASASELALKLMETCYMVAERFSSADFLHGPIAMVERDFPVILFAPPGKVFRDLDTLAQRLRTLQADALIISSEKRILDRASCSIRIPLAIPDLYSPIPYIIPGQLFAARLAEIKGLSPDRPRGLTKITRTY